MNESLQILSQNMGFLKGTYNMHSFMGIFLLLAIFDFALKGLGMWRAARMNKMYWFLALLLVNSAGILPIIFLLMTNEEYNTFRSSSAPKGT